MSIVPMQKIQFAVHRTAVEPVLSVVQECGVIEFGERPIFADQERAALQDIDTSFPNQYLLPRLQQAVQFLETYQKPQSLWSKLRHGTVHELKETQVAYHLQNVDVIQPVVHDAEALHQQLTVTQEELRVLREDLDLLTVWENLPYNLWELKTAYTNTWLISRTPHNESASLGDTLMSACTEYGIADQIHLEVISTDQCALTARVTEAVQTTVEAVCKSIDADIVTLPATSATTIEEAIVERRTRVQELETHEASLHAQAESLSRENLRDLQIKSDILRWQRDRYHALENAVASESVVIFEGWANARSLPALQKRLQELDARCVVVPVTPDTDEEPPVEIENSPALQPFEVVTRLYGLPGHRDLDPTAFLAGFFFLFFGLSLTDVGYGVFLMTAALLILFVFKVSSTVRLFGKLLLFMGASSTLVGLLFGGYLGIAVENLPSWLRYLQQFDPIGNPLPVFYLALGLGVVQVMFGMLLKIVSEARNNRLLDGLLDQGPWLALFTSLIFYGVAYQGVWAGAYTEQFLWLTYLSIGGIVVTSARHGDSLLSMLKNSLLSLYNSIGYFSDILSYSRLLALGLATTALAFAVNLIAEIVYEAVPYVGAVFAFLVLIVGHLFTLAVNTLGAFIHSARLQFVEFFGKFISGTGRMFRPFAREQHYVSVTSETK
jgi:V/A-type H+-transporting ATPase subunit I